MGRAYFTLAAAICGAALFFTFSKGAWLATGAALVVLVLPLLQRLPARRRKRVIVAGLAAGIPVVVALVAVALRFERFRSLVTGVLRIYLWRASLDMIRDHPIWGVGLDQFLYHYPRYILPEAWREPNLSHPHNVLLDFWLSLGILGVVALGWAAWIFVRRVRLPIERASERSNALLRGAAAAGLAMLLHGMVDNSYFVLDLAYTAWIVFLLVELATDQRTQMNAERRG
jgi:O-antigen ligase